jgi:hypothetical protein
MKKGSCLSSIDEIIELYRRNVDRTLIQAALSRTVEERIRALEEFEEFRAELRTAMERPTDSVRQARKS